MKFDTVKKLIRNISVMSYLLLQPVQQLVRQTDASVGIFGWNRDMYIIIDIWKPPRDSFFSPEARAHKDFLTIEGLWNLY